ncbi:MAG: AtpZ/AtpI family protein [Planctomycetota bacterium]|nr:AtpZ/AtpI family protein [Planctomycetota bacterium]
MVVRRGGSATGDDRKNRGDAGSGAYEDRPNGALPLLLRYAHIGLEWAVTVAVFAGIGFWLDGRWGVFPWLTICGAAIGIGTGSYRFLKSAYRGES